MAIRSKKMYCTLQLNRSCVKQECFVEVTLAKTSCPLVVVVVLRVRHNIKQM